MWWVVFIQSCGVSLFLWLLQFSNNLLSFWFIVDFMGFSLIPLFFLKSISSYRSLFYFVFVSAISTLFMVLGGLVLEYQTVFIFIGVSLKLGVFPFMSWLYNILEFSTWDVGWFLSGFLKFPFILLAYYGLSGCLSMEGVISLFWFGGFVVLSYNIWVYSGSWVRFWCHVVLSGSIILISGAYYCEYSLVCSLFVLYIFWISLVVGYFNHLNSRVYFKGHLELLVYFFLVVSTPLSLSFFYKVLSGVVIWSSPSLVVFGWLVYSLSEQLFTWFIVAGLNKVQARPLLYVFV